MEQIVNVVKTFFAGAGKALVDGIASFFYFILLWLNAVIYSFISYIYNIFLILSGGGSIFDADKINDLVSRIYIIIGVIVLFLVAYSLLKNMINPDESFKGKKSPINIIKDVVISIVLIAFVPTIFDFAFSFQESLLVNNTIGKIILGTPGDDTEINDTIRMGGYRIASSIWGAFIQVNDGYCKTVAEEENEVDSNGNECKKLYGSSGRSYGTLWQEAEKNTTFYDLVDIVPLITDGSVTYLFIFDIIAGVFVLFVLLSYCLDMALRLVKLAVYELMAPIPILARIIPNEQTKKIFSNWIKATLSTFAEVFIRIAILYFAVVIIDTVGDSIDNLFTNGAFIASNALPFTKVFAQALIVIGIIMFVRQFPQILKEMTGLDSGKYNVIKSAKQGLSLIAGGIAGRSPLAAARAYNQAGESKRLLDFSAIGNQYKRRMAQQAANELQRQAEPDARRRFATNMLNRTRHAFGFGTLKETADRNLENFRNIDGSPMTATNNTGADIKDQNGINIVKNGSTVELTPEIINRLNESKAFGERQKAEIQEQARKYNGVVEGNQQSIAYKGKMEDIAKKEFDKGKFYMTDRNGNNLVLYYTDQNGNQAQFGASGATKKELESWLEANRERMSAEEYARNQSNLNQSINDWSVRDFVDRNGAYIDRDTKKLQSENDDIKITKHQFAQQVMDGKLYEVTIDQQTGKERITEKNIGNMVSQFQGQEEKISWDIVSGVKKIGEEVNRQVSLKVNEQKIQEGTINSNISAINGMLDQGQKQVEVEKSGPTYKAYEASDKAHEMTENGGKK